MSESEIQEMPLDRQGRHLMAVWPEQLSNGERILIQKFLDVPKAIIKKHEIKRYIPRNYNFGRVKITASLYLGFVHFK